MEGSEVTLDFNVTFSSFNLSLRKFIVEFSLLSCKFCSCNRSCAANITSKDLTSRLFLFFNCLKMSVRRDSSMVIICKIKCL